jgi:hypothetical protein
MIRNKNESVPIIPINSNNGECKRKVRGLIFTEIILDKIAMQFELFNLFREQHIIISSLLNR